MNKFDFLKKLSLDELNLVDGITRNDILAERNSRKEQFDSSRFKVGDCFKDVHSDGDIFLFRIDSIEEQYANCTEIQILADGDFECYDDMDYSFTDMIEAEPISNGTFDLAKHIYNECVDAINSINKKYYNRIKALL